MHVLALYEPLTTGENMTKKKIVFNVLASVIVLVVICFALWLTWAWYHLGPREYDVTKEIASLIGVRYVTDVPIFIVEDDGAQKPWIARNIRNFPKTEEEFRQNPEGWPVRILDVLDKETQFEIASLKQRDSAVAGRNYLLSIRVSNGKYAGKTFNDMLASDLMQRDEKGRWALLPYVYRP